MKCFVTTFLNITTLFLGLTIASASPLKKGLRDLRENGFHFYVDEHHIPYIFSVEKPGGKIVNLFQMDADIADMSKHQSYILELPMLRGLEKAVLCFASDGGKEGNGHYEIYGINDGNMYLIFNSDEFNLAGGFSVESNVKDDSILLLDEAESAAEFREMVPRGQEVPNVTLAFRYSQALRKFIPFPRTANVDINKTNSEEFPDGFLHPDLLQACIYKWYAGEVDAGWKIFVDNANSTLQEKFTGTIKSILDSEPYLIYLRNQSEQGKSLGGETTSDRTLNKIDEGSHK